MKKFTIKKDHHYSKLFGFLPHFGLTFKNKFSYKIKFDEGCLYDFNTTDNYDINKLIGVSTSYFHHVQSARIGWRCIDGENIQILPYCYDNKKRINEFEDFVLGTVKPNELFECSIIIEDNSFTLTFNHSKQIILPKTNNSWSLKYLLFPFFGGNNTAPKKMSIWIENIV